MGITRFPRFAQRITSCSSASTSVGNGPPREVCMSASKVRTVCGSSARTDLCGRRSERPSLPRLRAMTDQVSELSREERVRKANRAYHFMSVKLNARYVWDLASNRRSMLLRTANSRLLSVAAVLVAFLPQPRRSNKQISRRAYATWGVLRVKPVATSVKSADE